MSVFQPPPVGELPIVEDPLTKKPIFSPLWLNWFIKLAKSLSASGAGSGDALTSQPLSQFAATTSAQLAGVLSDETGTGKVVFNSGPVLITAAVSGVWTAPSAWTVPAMTLGGTVSGGGQQVNNVIIGTVTPLAGAFTTLTAATSIKPLAAAGYLSSDGSAGFTGTITTASLVGKTVTIKDGIITDIA